MNDLVIFGSGGFAREALQIVRDLNRAEPAWRFLGFLDGDPARHGAQVQGHSVLGGGRWLVRNPEVFVAVAIGSPAAKAGVVQALRAAGHGRFATLVHPLAWVGESVRVGQGSILCAGSLITTDITIGDHVIVNLACTVGHDARIEDFVTVAPGVNLSGGVQLGEGVELGTGGALLPGVSVGSWSVVGAGAVVAGDLPANVTAVGVPAKPIKVRPDGWHRSPPGVGAQTGEGRESP